MARYIALVDGKAGAYGVAFPDLPGCTAMGKTLEEALANAAESLRDWVELTEKNGDAVPPPRPLEALRSDAQVAQALRAGATLAALPLIRETGKPVKANLSIDSGILSAIDEAAARRKLTRSAFIEMMVRRMLPELA
jgi:predicted RNase H-like HicB family nuclease